MLGISTNSMEDRMDEATGWKIVAKCYKTKVWTDFRVRVRTDKI